MHLMRISTTQVSSVMLRSKNLEIRKKKCETVKEPLDENQTESHEIEPNPSKDRGVGILFSCIDKMLSISLHPYVSPSSISELLSYSSIHSSILLRNLSGLDVVFFS
jgi:hypothetical protein